MDKMYPADECDVVDKDKLARFQEKRKEWLISLREDPEISISQQITSMLMLENIHRAIRKARELSIESGSSNASLNDPLVLFNDIGYLSIQSLAIRRIMEREADNPSRQVISLRRLSNDIKSNKNLITREIFVSSQGVPYDFEPARSRWFENQGSEPRADILPSDGPDAWSKSVHLHKNFDTLSGVSEEGRTRDDRIQQRVWIALDHQFDNMPIEAIKTYVDKKLAHAADSESRSATDNPIETPKYSQIRKCHQVICGVANFISAELLRDASYGFVPTPQFDPCEYLDHPWLPSTDVASLRKIWPDFHEEVSEWTRDVSKAILDDPR